MKKSLVLSIIMTLVMVVAMSTATFAWYTANSSVDAEISNITAATAAGDLQIAMAINGQTVSQDSTAYSQSIAIQGATYTPCMPTKLLSAADVSWQQGTLDADSKWTLKDDEFSGVTGTITLSNKSSSATGAITATIDTVIPNDDTAKGLKEADVCVVIVNEAGDTVYASTTYNYGECTTNSYDGITTGSQVSADIPAIAGNNSVRLTFYIWFNGKSVVNTNMGGTFAVNFAFDAAEPQV